jgi:hypothetical protein
MRWLRFIVAAVLLIIAGLWGVLRVLPVWRARDITPVMAAYLRAAAAGDSAALTRVSASPAAVGWALLVHRGAPAFLEEAARHARPEWVQSDGDTTIASFRIPPVPDPQCIFRPLDNVQGKFLRGADGRWRIFSASVPIC